MSAVAEHRPAQITIRYKIAKYFCMSIFLLGNSVPIPLYYVHKHSYKRVMPVVEIGNLKNLTFRTWMFQPTSFMYYVRFFRHSLFMKPNIGVNWGFEMVWITRFVLCAVLPAHPGAGGGQRAGAAQPVRGGRGARPPRRRRDLPGARRAARAARALHPAPSSGGPRAPRRRRRLAAQRAAPRRHWRRRRRRRH